MMYNNLSNIDIVPKKRSPIGNGRRHKASWKVEVALIEWTIAVRYKCYIQHYKAIHLDFADSIMYHAGLTN